MEHKEELESHQSPSEQLQSDFSQYSETVETVKVVRNTTLDEGENYRKRYAASRSSFWKRRKAGKSEDLEGKTASQAIPQPPTGEKEPCYRSPESRLDGVSSSNSTSVAPPNMAIFVHSGAGVHSKRCAPGHLRVCQGAAKVAMALLRAGAPATEAVVAAVKYLEDAEVTNAGFGSNLTIDGQVELDASIVDHLGRSGGCGAVPNIPNPISVAKLILDQTMSRMLLLVPNLLAGTGARDFAAENGMRVVPNSQLIAPHVYITWQRLMQPHLTYLRKHAPEIAGPHRDSMAGQELLHLNPDVRTALMTQEVNGVHGSHIQPQLQAFYQNQLQYYLQRLALALGPGELNTIMEQSINRLSMLKTNSSPLRKHVSDETNGSSAFAIETINVSMDSEKSHEGTYGMEREHTHFEASASRMKPTKRRLEGNSLGEDYYRPIIHQSQMLEMALNTNADDNSSKTKGSDIDDMEEMDEVSTPELVNAKMLDGQCSTEVCDEVLYSCAGRKRRRETDDDGYDGDEDGDDDDDDDDDDGGHCFGEASLNDDLEDYMPELLKVVEGSDLINDTVGAIAIDSKGHIAAGASSGGIAMKHRGRVGPAALARVGIAVVPVHPLDEEGLCVATVASGTGEHMLTTMASQRCSERIYHGTRQGPDGRDVLDDNDDVIMSSFIEHDFMNHPGVRSCRAGGAIGLLTVKSSREGIYFYFAHNTDSFSVASMSSSDREPLCVISRRSSRTAEGAITQGGRKV